VRQVIAGLGVGVIGIAFIVDRLNSHGRVPGYIGGGLVVVGLLFVLAGLRQIRIRANAQNER